MILKIALIGATTLFALSIAAAQSSSPESTAGGATGTSKSDRMEQPAPAGSMDQQMPRQGTTGTAPKGHSSPDSTAGGAQGTTKGGPNTPGTR